VSSTAEPQGPVPVPKRPQGLQRRLLKAPVWLYRLRLGRLLGGRFLLLRHRGRRTGAVHETVLEVIGREGDELYVISGFGRSSDWLRNIRAAPPLLVESGSRSFVPEARFLDAGEAASVLRSYAARNPRAAAILGKRLYGGAFEPDRLAAATTVVGLRPRPADVPRTTTGPA
jgi:deazaflavin-dependent oxidoreductase (nitroreductase family)